VAIDCGKLTPEHASNTMGLIDLTHTFDADMPVYPGDPVPQFTQTARFEIEGYCAYCLRTGMHTGTHMDAPLHMLSGGDFVCDVPIEKFVGRGRLIDARGRESVTDDLLNTADLTRGDIVLVLTGWYKRFRDPDYFESFPDITPAFAERLVSAGVSIMALDTPSPDRAPYPVHKILLANNVLIIENLTALEALVGIGEFEVIALPSKFRCEAAPVRVIARTT
jgi:kynurenine formamidase